MTKSSIKTILDFDLTKFAKIIKPCSQRMNVRAKTLLDP